MGDDRLRERHTHKLHHVAVRRQESSFRAQPGPFRRGRGCCAGGLQGPQAELLHAQGDGVLPTGGAPGQHPRGGRGLWYSSQPRADGGGHEAGGVSVFEDENTIKKFFVSGGFACIHPSNVADIAAVEAFPVDELDPEAVKSGVEEWTAKLASATEESEKQHAEVALDVHKAMEQALEDTSK